MNNPQDNPRTTAADLQYALAQVEENGFGENVDDDSIIEDAAREHLAYIEQHSPATWTWDEIRTALDEERAAWARHTALQKGVANEVLDGIEGRLAEQVRARGYRNTEDRS